MEWLKYSYASSLWWAGLQCSGTIYINSTLFVSYYPQLMKLGGGYCVGIVCPPLNFRTISWQLLTGLRWNFVGTYNTKQQTLNLNIHGQLFLISPFNSKFTCQKQRRKLEKFDVKQKIDSTELCLILVYFSNKECHWKENICFLRHCHQYYIVPTPRSTWDVVLLLILS